MADSFRVAIRPVPGIPFRGRQLGDFFRVLKLPPSSNRANHWLVGIDPAVLRGVQVDAAVQLEVNITPS